MQTAAHAALEQLAGIAWQDVRSTLLQDLKAMPVNLGDDVEVRPCCSNTPRWQPARPTARGAARPAPSNPQPHWHVARCPTHRRCGPRGHQLPCNHAGIAYSACRCTHTNWWHRSSIHPHVHVRNCRLLYRLDNDVCHNGRLCK